MSDEPLQEDEVAKLTDQFLHFAVKEERANIVAAVKEFQTKHSDVFANLKIDENSEHKHEWSDIYTSYVAILEGTAEKFCKQHDLSNDQLLQILNHIKTSMPDMWLPFASLLSRTDYISFARCLAEGTCLCCGGHFSAEGRHEYPDLPGDDEGDSSDT